MRGLTKRSLFGACAAESGGQRASSASRAMGRVPPPMARRSSCRALARAVSCLGLALRHRDLLKSGPRRVAVRRCWSNRAPGARS